MYITTHITHIHMDTQFLSSVRSYEGEVGVMESTYNYIKMITKNNKVALED